MLETLATATAIIVTMTVINIDAALTQTSRSTFLHFLSASTFQAFTSFLAAATFG